MRNATAIFTTIALGTVLVIGSATASMARGGVGGHGHGGMGPGADGNGHGGSGNSIVMSNGADDGMSMARNHDSGREYHRRSDGFDPFWLFSRY
ncbi:hypothetical protein FJ417_27670 [Mesorhizobium sp. B3-1-7]|uniref:hypothetical protein n=1 Tax=Mesorhizobium sp. B3-1-7 TaxID=2589894 RepID=UPI00112B82E6|nr:hypothetical protein [Mesorhizobium sp. B3-1-7]TPI51903.1 hypothetical protein FJ417_27670 [Mesorhizobium sp. B3-1-7]